MATKESLRRSKKSVENIFRFMLKAFNDNAFVLEIEEEPHENLFLSPLILTHIKDAIQSVNFFPMRGLSGFMMAMYLLIRRKILCEKKDLIWRKA